MVRAAAAARRAGGAAGRPHRAGRRRQRGRRRGRALAPSRWTRSSRSTRSTGSPWCSPAWSTPRCAAAVAEQGLRYPPDPGSWESSTIGGNVATNAGGMCCVKYGVTAEYVLGLEVVLASGEVLRTGRRTAKGVAGYDLTRLFVGSEGTLGVITEVTVGAAAGRRRVADAGRGLPDDGRRRRRGRRDRRPAGSRRACWSCSTRRTCGRSRRTGRWGCVPTPRRCCWPPSTPARGPPADLPRSPPRARRPARVEVYAATDAVEAAALLQRPPAGPPGDGEVRRRRPTRRATAA